MTFRRIMTAACLIIFSSILGCSGSNDDIAANEGSSTEPLGPHTCTETSCGVNEECVVVSQSVCGVPCEGARDPRAICGENFSCTSLDGEEATCMPRPPMTPECSDFEGCLNACDGDDGVTKTCIDDCISASLTTEAVSDVVEAWLSCGEDKGCVTEVVDFDCMEFDCGQQLMNLETACRMPGDWCEDPKACAQICDTASADATQCPEGTQCAESGHCL